MLGSQNDPIWILAMLAGSAIGLSLAMVATLAYAAIPGNGGVISACVSTAGFNGQHILTLPDVSQRSACGQGQMGHVSSDAIDQQLYNTGLTGGGSPGVITASEPIMTNGVVTGWRVKANRTLNGTLVPLIAWVLCAS